MPKSSKPKKKEDAPIKADIKIDGDVTNANIIVGHGNTINIEAVKTATSLFTIPLPVKDFTGREKEIEELKAAFSRGAVITGVSGGGGVGKTELTRRLAHELADDFPAARMSIDLLGTSENPLTSEEVMRRILEPFYPNQKLPDDPDGLKGLYQQTFASKKALLLLDNAANAAQVRPLIPPPPSAAIVTSRQHFALTEFDLTPLRLDVLSPEKSLEFLRSASLKLKDAPDAEMDALATLCGRLPLALRVAASLLDDRDDWTPGTLLKRLEDERTRLLRLKRDSDPDLDVESVLSLSYNLLGESLKEKFRRLGVFTAPFVRISAQAVWELEDEAEADDLLGTLTNRSLLTPSPAGEGAGGEVLFTYALHDLTRLFALERLLEDEAEAKTTAMRHADHFLGWGSAADDLYEKGNENIPLGLAQFRFIWAHLQSAYERLLPENKTFPRPDDADRWLSRFPNQCAYVLDLHLPPRQKIPFMQAALSAAQRLGEKQVEGSHFGNLGLAYAALGDAHKAIEFYEKQLAIVRRIGKRQSEGAALTNLGNAYSVLGDQHKALEFFEQALLISREVGDHRSEGGVFGNLGLVYAALGDAHKAIEFYEKQLVVAEEKGDLRSKGNALANLGLAYVDLGDVNSAIELFGQSLMIDHQIGDRHGASANLSSIGNAYALIGDLSKAIKSYELALEIVRELGDRRGEDVVLGNLGNAYALLGNTNKAIEFYELALFIDREISDRRGEGADLGNLGNAYAALGDMRKAIDFYEQQLVIVREIGDRRGEGNALGNLGSTYYSLEDARTASEFFEKQLTIAREISDRRGEGNALGNLGSAYYALGDANKAIKFYEQALVISHEIGDRQNEGNWFSNLGIIYQTLGKTEKAKKVWEQALQIFRAIESPHVKRVEGWLAGLDGDDGMAERGMTAEDFIRMVFQVMRAKHPQGEQLFGQLSKMALDSTQPPEIQNLAKVLRDVMAGVKEPDLSALPEELANLVREELKQ